jgi:hypothetical protein
MKKKLFFRDATQKSALVVPSGIEIKMVPSEPIFEQMSSSSRKREGIDPN